MYKVPTQICGTNHKFIIQEQIICTAASLLFVLD